MQVVQRCEGMGVHYPWRRRPRRFRTPGDSISLIKINSGNYELDSRTNETRYEIIENLRIISDLNYNFRGVIIGTYLKQGYKQC